MVADQDTLWKIEPHTSAKHEILQRYLKAWFPILNKWHNRIVYIDGFCGPGRYRGGEPGSPIIALDVAANHRRTLSGEVVFWFIDERQDRIDHLKRELASHAYPSHFRIYSQCGTFHELLDTVLESLDCKGTSLAPTFAFVDPFGFKGIPFSVIKRLLGHKRCEVLITFMVRSISRFLGHPRDEIVQHIVDAFGTEECIQIAQEHGDRIAKLRDLYQKQLMTVAKFVRAFAVSNRQNQLLYFLFFASNHRLGHIKIKEAMRKVDPEGLFSFSDRTDPAQGSLFAEYASPVLRQLLEEKFADQGVIQVTQIREFVEDETRYLAMDMREVLKREEAEEKIRVHKDKADGKKRKKGTFPDEVVLEYVTVS